MSNILSGNAVRSAENRSKHIFSFFILLVLLSSCNSIFAHTLTGKVLNENNHPLEKVTILNLTNQQHTHTDEQGKFSFHEVAVGDTLEFSHIGYQSLQLIIKNIDSPLEIILSPKLISLDEIVITPQKNPLELISAIDIQTAPLKSSQDVLRKVPGLFIGQHAGGGKAEQIFLRGFDIDHGTDVQINVDGLPVNMVSHAHGQGYADLHFVIPEIIENVNFGKGPYFVDKGNFNTAGYVDFTTKKHLHESTVKLEGGQFDTYRLLGMFDVLHTENHNAYIAGEYLVTDGFFESSQNFDRTNLFGKYSGVYGEDELDITASYFTSEWDASGQIPQRAVDQGLIGRFGAIDDTEGGNTSRTNLSANYLKKFSETASLKTLAYWSHYDFELYSNFTFFLEDPVNGDQIRQKEARNIFGIQTAYTNGFASDKLDGFWTAGLEVRYDNSDDNELSHTKNRTETLERIQYGDIDETNVNGYLGATFIFNKWKINPSIRLDYFDFKYHDKLQLGTPTFTKDKAIVSPKINFTYSHSDQFQWYLKGGKGFHSNDTRVVVTETDKETLPAAYGIDFGTNWKPARNLFINLAYWYLHSDQEFVYVGDAGIVEPSGKSKRQGFELSSRLQLTPWLFWNLDANYTIAKAIEEPSGMDYIPLAPDFTLVSGLNIVHKSGFKGGLDVRFIDDRPANEDNSIVAEGYTVVDMNLNYDWNHFTFGIQIQNLLDTEWNETQFATESRLFDEPAPVEEIHFTPGTPFFLKGILAYTF